MKNDMTYLVVEVQSAYMVVLDNSGRFIKAANPGCEVGDIVEKIIPLIYPQDKKKQKNKIISLAAGMAACVCLGMFGIYEYQYAYTEYGNVYMQINPEVEISLSRSGRVLDIEGENADGKALVGDYKYEGKDKETVVDELASLAIEQDYLEDGGRIALVVDGRSESWAAEMEKELSDELNRYLSEQDITIEIIIGPMPAEEDDKEVLEETQSVTIPVPQTPEETDDPEYEDDGMTDYAAPSDTGSQSSQAPSSSAPAPAAPSAPAEGDSGYDDADSDGDSAYSSDSSSSYDDDDD